MSKLFGGSASAAWADTRRIKRDSRGQSGVIIGTVDGQPLIDTSPNPVVVLGPCNSGKGSSIVVPSLLTWQEGAVVTDVQGELYGLTKHWRRSGARNDVRRLAFGDPNSPDTFNFLAAIPRGTPGELAEIQALAASLLDDGQHGDAFWRHHAQSLLSLFIIAARSQRGAALCDVQYAVADDARFGATIAVHREAIPDNDLGRAAHTAAAAYAEQSGNVRAAVRAMVASAMAIFASPVVAKNTVRSSFDLAQLRDSEAPMTVYLTFAADDLGRLQPLIRAFLAQVVRHGTQERPRTGVHRLLLVLDGFTALGRLDFMASSLGYLPGYGIKPLLTIQNLSRLTDMYGEKNVVWGRGSIRTVLPIKDFETAFTVAKDLGSALAQSGKVGTEQRPAITPDDLMRLGEREAIILGAADKPIRASILPYFEDAWFRDRVEAGRSEAEVALSA